ncbi:unnamed protein product [Rhizophagus irregularis]|nr:unnamed protein product [Rhizophagus irregularis]
MDKYRFLSTILYNIGGFGGIFHTQYRLTRNGCYRISAELGNGDRFRPVNLKLGSILACNSDMGTGGFRPGTQKWRPISAWNSEMETDFGPELRNGDRF